MRLHFGKPLLESDLFDALLAFPEFNAVRTLGLKFLNLFAWKFFTCAAEIKPFFARAAKHKTVRAEGITAVRAATVAGNFFGSASHFFGKAF